MSEHYDLIVIGSGEGGKYLAWTLAGQGQKVVVVERRWIGGSCPNTNCLPSKNEIWSAETAHSVRHSAQMGIGVESMTVDMRRVVERKREMVRGLIDMHLDLFRSSGAELAMGHAQLTGPRRVRVELNDGGRRDLTAEKIVLNLGTSAEIPAVPGLAEAMPMTHVEILELDALPRHLLIIGAGYVGLELGQAYRRFGAEVTLLETGSQIASREDADVSGELRRLLEAEGIIIHTGVNIRSVRGRSGDAVEVSVANEDAEWSIGASHILVAAGRRPNTRGIGLEEAGVALTPRGMIAVDERLETTTPGIWAIGECAGSPAFTHASLDDFRIIRDNLAGGNRSTRDRLMPYCLFTDPPLGRTGLTETEAKALGHDVRVAKLPMARVLRSRTTGRRDGFMKAIIGPDDRLLGFAMLGAEGGEVMAAVHVAMLAGLPYTAIRDAIIAHPTNAEGLNALFSAVPRA
ncbi:FAD-dependent oxidoreductase [Nguyenibacter vanlangensis]|uniref:FAD-dependent oxidoreductase n=1 Tax=Nguyenibacter vanlangensis TaxID=1216886 RepID=A0ABZ3DBF7_9PROT